MPDARLQRTRETLPKGYQFGDAAMLGDEVRRFFERRRTQFVQRGWLTRADFDLHPEWRAPHENDAEQLTRQQRTGEETV